MDNRKSNTEDLVHCKDILKMIPLIMSHLLQHAAVDNHDCQSDQAIMAIVFKWLRDSRLKIIEENLLPNNKTFFAVNSHQHHFVSDGANYNFVVKIRYF